MMASKTLVTLAYVAFASLLAVSPWLSRLVPALAAWSSRSWREQVALALWVLAAIAVLTGSASLPWLAACGVVAALIWKAERQPDWQHGVGLTAGLVLAASLLWWHKDASGLQLDPTEVVVAAIIAAVVAAALGLWLAPNAAGSGEHATVRTSPFWPAWLVYLGICGLACFSTFALVNASGAANAWHHWGAYIGPAEMVLAGAHLFQDFPAQYGLGPTLAVAAACGHDCWPGFYWLAASAAFAYCLLLGALCLEMCPPGAGRVARSLALAVALVSALVWTDFPPQLGNPLVFPSTTGLRFAPAMLVAWIAIRGGAAPTRLWVGTGTLAWAFGVLWSPESAIYCTFVWWPLRMALAAAETGAQGAALPWRLLRGALPLLAALLGLLAAFLAAYDIAYGHLPDPQAVFAYLLYPPGPLPISFNGAVLFGLAVMALGFGQLVERLESADPAQAAGSEATALTAAGLRLFVALLLALATLSYFLLGRSHDNNLLNVSPFLVLALLATLASGARTEWRAAGIGLLAGYLALASTANFGIWSGAVAQDRLFKFDPRVFLQHFDFNDGNMATVLRARYGQSLSPTPEIGALARTAVAGRHERYSVITSAMVLPRESFDDVWDALHGAENYAYLPPAMRQLFLRRTAQRLQRCGWLIVDGRYAGEAQGYPSKIDWANDYAAVYDMTEQLKAGTVLAFHLRPHGQAACDADHRP